MGSRLAERFPATRRRHILTIARQGPTEIGYAYFRARRRRRNRADDEPELSESDRLALSGAFDVTAETLADNARTVAAYRASTAVEIRSVQWFLPFFHHAYFGGTHTLLRFADRFARAHGVDNRFHVYDVGSEQARGLPAKIAAAFPALAGATITSAGDTPLDALPECDAAIATLWSSAYPVVHFRRARSKFYFVQDFEPQFYPAGAASVMAEETYRFGLPGIVNTPGLAEAYRAYGNPAVSFVPAVDLHRYRPSEASGDGHRPVRVFFYGRPKTSRNAFGLGLAALAQLKDRFGDRVDIVCAGEEWNPGQYGVAGRIRNVGVLPNLDEVAELYRSCDIGLVFMGTKHPSYQPFEFMASGMATVSNLNPSTTWLLRDGENCLLTAPLPTPVATGLGRLVADAGLRGRIRAAGLAEVSRYRWEEQIDGVWASMCRRDEAFALTRSGG